AAPVGPHIEAVADPDDPDRDVGAQRPVRPKRRDLQLLGRANRVEVPRSPVAHHVPLPCINVPPVNGTGARVSRRYRASLRSSQPAMLRARAGTGREPWSKAAPWKAGRENAGPRRLRASSRIRRISSLPVR